MCLGRGERAGWSLVSYHWFDSCTILEWNFENGHTWIRSQYWEGGDWGRLSIEVILHWLNLGSSILIHSQVPLYSSCDAVTFPTFMGPGMFWSHSRTSCKNVPFSFGLIQSKHHQQKAVCVQKFLYHFQDAAAISLTWTTGFFDCLSSLITYESKLDFCIVSVTPLFGIPSMILNAWNLFFFVK